VILCFFRIDEAATFRSFFNRRRSAMQVFFESRDPDAAPLRELAVRRVQFVMRRLTWLVPRAKVQLSDVNGPRGGVDKRCQLELKTDGGGSVVITAVARDWRTALDSALARAARVLTRLLRRSHDPQRAQAHTLRFER
jgi:ribosome-associated translation inhibitor RaiA